MNDPDPRTIPARRDLASISLVGFVEAERFAEAAPRLVVAPSLPLRRSPEADSPMDTELLYGERFDSYEDRNGWSWGQSATDRYVGYVRTCGLGSPQAAATHRVRARSTFRYREPTAAAQAIGRLWFGSRVTAQGRRNRFQRLAGGGWTPVDHLSRISRRTGPRDPAGVACELIGAPYLFGGRTPAGLDCSALVQLAFDAVGVAAPRDSDQQFAALGRALHPSEGRRRGDLAFWPRHVGILADSDTLVHASGRHMAVVVEPYEEAAARIGRITDGFQGFRRMRGCTGGRPHRKAAA